MNKIQLIREITKSYKCTSLSKKNTEELVDLTFKLIQNAIKKNKRFSYPGFGTFVMKNRKARKGRNPQTGEEISIKASKTVAFKPAPKMKSYL